MPNLYFYRIANYYPNEGCYDSMLHDNYSYVDNAYYEWLEKFPRNDVDLIKVTDKKNQIIKRHKPFKNE